MPGIFNGFCSGFGGYSPIGMILSWVIVIGLVAGLVMLLVWLWRRAGAGGSQSPGALHLASPAVSPRELLQVRYARGEITREQYRQMLEDLE